MPILNQYITYRSSTTLTVADVFREHWDEYRRKHRVSPQQAKVVGAMMSLRQAQDVRAGRRPWVGE